MMILTRGGSAAGLVLLLALPPWNDAGEAQERSRAGADSLRITGAVVDQATGEELPGVAITVLVPEETVVWKGLTDGSGSFASTRIPAGMYELRSTALGYEPVSRTIDLTAGSPGALRIEMVPTAVELAPVVVTTRPSRLVASGFYERRRLGIGHSYTRDEIEARNPMRPSDLMRMVPGMRVVPIRGGSGAALRYRGNCQPDVVIDGMAVPRHLSIDDVLNVEDLEAVEVHSGTSQPARLGPSTCGTVLAWTREGQASEGRPMTWTRALIAAAFVALALIASR